MKSIFIALVAAVAAAFTACAAIPVGSWSMYTSFSNPATRVVETSDKVFYLGGGGLFSYDKGTSESKAYSIDNVLSDYYVTDIYPDNSNGRIAVAYSSGNIDIIDTDDTVINMSDIRDASTNLSKKINGLAWKGNRLFAATGFGVVEFDVDSRKVVQSGIYNRNITAIGIAGNTIVISEGNDLLAAKAGDNLRNFETWKKVHTSQPASEIAALNSSSIIARCEGNVLKLTFSGDTLSELSHIGFTTVPFFYTDRGAAFISGNSIVADGEIFDMPQQAQGDIFGGTEPKQQVWTLNSNGIASFVRTNNSWSAIGERVRPYSFSVREASFIIPDRTGQKIYFTNLGPTVYRNAASTENEGIFTLQQTDMLKDGVINDVAAREVKLGSVASEFLSSSLRRAAATTRLAEDTDDESTYFIGTGNDGLYKVTNGIFAGKYDNTNSPMGTPWGSRVYEVSFDKGGNMWVGADGLTSSTGIMVLPASKKRLEPNQVKISDWYLPDMKGFENGKDIRIFHCTQSPVIFIFSSNGQHCFAVCHTNGTPDNFSDDKIVLWNDLTDTDGKTFSPARVTSIAEDRNGNVWMGTTEGVFEISSPEEALDASLRVRRLKIDHGDGTGLSDYLAGSDLILDIAVDGANRKWIATQESGVYLVNPQGNEIISHFTAANSPLPEQKVNAVYALTTDNSVYFATPQGIMVYGGNSVSPASELSQLKVYPNPVTPDYGGNVTIEGLTDGALVKIADSAGAVIWQSRAEGGMATWNVTDASGKRVRTGIYYIFASTAANTSSKGAVAKITVVN